MAEDGLLPPIFAKTNKGNPTVGLLLNGVIVALIAGFVPFGEIADMMVLGTLVAFTFVGIGAIRLKLVNPLIALAAVIGCIVLAFNLNPLVLQVYSITCPVGLLIYALYGYKHSKLRSGEVVVHAPEPAH
jgi:APA family basic amino acid/polyamine antiporter